MPNRLNVLLLEPFAGGSHSAFNHGWRRYSRHHFTLLELPGVHWKWRSRHASLTLAHRAQELVDAGQRFDIVVCSDMLNLPEWRGFVGPHLAGLPTIAYFHENQFTYPLARGQTRDYHYAYNNVLTALAAQEIWFNSSYHLHEFSAAARRWLQRMPDNRHLAQFDEAMKRTRVCWPGIDMPAEVQAQADSKQRTAKTRTGPGVPLIGWVARWEFDKGPAQFTDAMERLISDGVPFELCLLGQVFERQPAELERLHRVASDRIAHSGFATSKEQYWKWLSKMDIVVSTAIHEFFGIAIVEAIAAGATPLLPDRLAYPEVLALEANPEHQRFLYDGTTEGLVLRLGQMLMPSEPAPALEHLATRFHWRVLATHYDDLLLQQL